MTFEEIFNAIHGRAYLALDVSNDERNRAVKELGRLSDTEWDDWVDYKNDRLDTIRRNRSS